MNLPIQVVIGLGSNLGDGEKNILSAWERLGSHPGITPVNLSSPYLSAPLGMTSANQFTNAVGMLATGISCPEMLAVLLETEKAMGRDRKNGRDRTIDLDILYYGDLICSEPSLIVPHPEIQNRLFVLAPMAEIAPDRLHPLLGKTTERMLCEIMSAGQIVTKTSWR